MNIVQYAGKNQENFPYSSCWKGKCQNSDKHHYGYTWEKGEIPDVVKNPESVKKYPSVDESYNYIKTPIKQKRSLKDIFLDILETCGFILIPFALLAVAILILKIFLIPFVYEKLIPITIFIVLFIFLFCGV